jgi:ABC-type multidrug transport system permease subunit
LKPYSNIKTQHLKLLLLLARVTVYIGLLVLIIAVVAVVAAFFGKYLSWLPIVLTLISLALSVLFLSGVMAAIVAFEESYRLRTEVVVSKNET